MEPFHENQNSLRASPTGYLCTSARAHCLFILAFRTSPHGGEFVLRIEDTDLDFHAGNIGRPSWMV